MKRAIVPGSFDPITLGHLELIRAASARYDEVVVAVMVNAQKQYLFDMATRVRMAELTVQDLPNVRVIGDEGLLIDLYDRLEASAVFKSYRNETDLAYETEMAEWNRAHNPHFVTELVRAEGKYATVSSTQVRERLAAGDQTCDLVHPDILPLLHSK